MSSYIIPLNKPIIAPETPTNIFDWVNKTDRTLLLNISSI